MNLKNYTTEVPASRSIDNIEKMLVEFGCSNIMKEYTDLPPLPGKICSSIHFMVEMSGQKLAVKLPANVHKVYAWLKKKRPTMTDKSRAEQANRIAWKQQYEILHLQLGQIETDQLEKIQVFLPHVFDIHNQQTFYEKIKTGKFTALLPPSNQ